MIFQRSLQSAPVTIATNTLNITTVMSFGGPPQGQQWLVKKVTVLGWGGAGKKAANLAAGAQPNQAYLYSTPTEPQPIQGGANQSGQPLTPTLSIPAGSDIVAVAEDMMSVCDFNCGPDGIFIPDGRSLVALAIARNDTAGSLVFTFTLMVMVDQSAV